ncbi:hypothetical protein CHS0354_021690 [Potamilus streckersoni]|uniref:Fanconi anemia group D2 protein n=1 Tax=Potamilus streckersoni TaxID=2493646 RepID=A0AAE0WET7_9BIVA|nr:hypothetical protein CHS0354_021690 [Potamilus streckersoni]
MELDKSTKMKRKVIDQPNRGSANVSSGIGKKRKGSKESEDDYKDDLIFCRLINEAGIQLKNGNKYNEIVTEQAVFQRNLCTAMKKQIHYQEVLDDFVEGFQKYIEEPKRFHHSLLPCITPPDCESIRSGCRASVVKILLGVDIIQPQIMNVLLEKLAELIGDEDTNFIENGMIVNLPHLLMSQFQWLDRIVNSKEVTQKMLEIISVAHIDVQREIICCLPKVVEDSEHADVAVALRDILVENNRLTVPILDALSNLTLKLDILAQVRESVIQSLASVEMEDLPVVVKFLLQSVNTQDAFQVISELRANLDFSVSTFQSMKKPGNSEKSTDIDASHKTDALILDAIRSAIQYQKNVAETWIKVLESLKQPGDHRMIDIFVLLILHATPRKKAVESLFRNKIRSGCFTEALLKPIYMHHSKVLQDYFTSLLSIVEVLLRSPEPAILHFACVLYKLTFKTFQAYHQQEIVGNLVAHIGSGFEREVDASLEILVDLVETDLPKMSPFAILVKGVLDYIDNLSVSQIRKLYQILSVLAFKNPQQGGLIQDDLYIVIRKELSDQNTKYKRMGIIGGIFVMKNIVQCVADESSMREDQYRQIVNLLQLVKTSSSQTPEAASLFLDELSSVIMKGQLHAKIEDWISENMTADFQDKYVVDLEETPQGCGGFSIEPMFGLDDEIDGAIAINLLSCVVQSQDKAAKMKKDSLSADPVCMAPHFRLLHACEMRQSGDLVNIDALLGCPLYMIKDDIYEKLESLSTKEKDTICGSLFFAINWFIEVVNGFANQTDPEMKWKVITRLHNITTLRDKLQLCLKACPNFKPPAAIFDLEESVVPTFTAPSISKVQDRGKKRGRKPAKRKAAKTGSDDEDKDSRESTVLENDSQTGIQESEKPDSKEKAAVNLAAYRAYFRELDLSVFTILNFGHISKAALDTEMNTKATTEILIQPPQLKFLLEDFCQKLEHSLIACQSKRRTLFKSRGDKKVGFSNLDQYSPLDIATIAVKLLPALCNHLEGVVCFFQSMIAQNDGLIDGPGSHSDESIMMGSCCQYLIQAILAIFSWNGFQMPENRDLLKEGLNVLVHRIKSHGQTQMIFSDLLIGAIKYVENLVSIVPDLTTAVLVMKLLICLTEKGKSHDSGKNLAKYSEEILKREWLGPDREKDRGTKYNENLQMIIKTYIVYSENPLVAMETIATKGIPELLEADKDKNAGSITYPTMTKASFPVYYRVMFSELLESIKSIQPTKQSDSREVGVDRLLQWNSAVRILHILINLIKAFDARGNLGSALKYGRQFVDIFLRQGMPLLDKMFRTHRADIQGLLKNLQLSTRAMHHVCGHSKIMKDVALTNQVPMLKRSLEGFVFRVKAMLTVNKCLEAFWLGNLKNRDLQGEEILSQTSTVEESNTRGTESEGEETIPDDDGSESEVEMDNQSNGSNETENESGDKEGSYSQLY